MYIFKRTIYNNLLKNNKKRFFSSNIDNNLNIINENIRGLYILGLTNMFVSFISLFS